MVPITEFLFPIASPSTYPSQSVSGSLGSQCSGSVIVSDFGDSYRIYWACELVPLLGFVNHSLKGKHSFSCWSVYPGVSSGQVVAVAVVLVIDTHIFFDDCQCIMMSLSVDIVAIIVISTGKTADRAEKARGAWFSPTQKPSGCPSQNWLLIVMMVVVITKKENRKVMIRQWLSWLTWGTPSSSLQGRDSPSDRFSWSFVIISSSSEPYPVKPHVHKGPASLVSLNVPSFTQVCKPYILF